MAGPSFVCHRGSVGDASVCRGTECGVSSEMHFLPPSLPFLYSPCENQQTPRVLQGDSLGVNPKIKLPPWDWHPGGGTATGASPGGTWGLRASTQPSPKACSPSGHTVPELLARSEAPFEGCPSVGGRVPRPARRSGTGNTAAKLRPRVWASLFTPAAGEAGRARQQLGGV